MFRSLIQAPPDQQEGAVLLYDPETKEVILKAWQEDHEIAFARIPVDTLLAELGLDRYIKAQARLELGKLMGGMAGVLEARKVEVEREAAELLCPFKPGDIVECSGPTQKGRFEVVSIHPHHNSWGLSTYRLGKHGERSGHNIVHLSYTDQLRTPTRPR